MAELIIDPEEVNKAFLEALFTESEVRDLGGREAPEGAVLVEGIRHRFGFHPERLEEKRDEVRCWLRALPHQFHADGGEDGGGWSFLNACNQENGMQWTGLHQRMEQLFCLGMGLGYAVSLFPRAFWDSIPGGMPYYLINLSEQRRTKEEILTHEETPQEAA